MNEQLDRIEARLQALEGKIDLTYQAAHKVVVYMKWTGIITVAAIAIPAVIIPFLIPSFLASQGVGNLNTLLGQ